MAKVTIEFDTNEDAEGLHDALNGSKYRFALNDLDEEFRQVTKYGQSSLNPTNQAKPLEVKIAAHYRERIREILSNYELFLS